MQHTTPIISRIVRATAWAVVAAVVATLAAATLLPKLTDYRTVVITGRSMTGSIPIGSLVVVEPVADTAVRVGDVVTFDKPDGSGGRVTHRVIDTRTTKAGTIELRTKGDNNRTADDWKIQYVDATAYRAVGHAPMLGRVMMTLQSPNARIALVFIPVLLVLGSVLRSIWMPATTTPSAPRHGRAAV